MNEATSVTTEKVLRSERQARPSPDLRLLERLVAPPLLGPLGLSKVPTQRELPSTLSQALPGPHTGLGRARFKKEGSSRAGSS